MYGLISAGFEGPFSKKERKKADNKLLRQAINCFLLHPDGLIVVVLLPLG